MGPGVWPGGGLRGARQGTGLESGWVTLNAYDCGPLSDSFEPQRHCLYTADKIDDRCVDFII